MTIPFQKQTLWYWTRFLMITLGILWDITPNIIQTVKTLQIEKTTQTKIMLMQNHLKQLGNPLQHPAQQSAIPMMAITQTLLNQNDNSAFSIQSIRPVLHKPWYGWNTFIIHLTACGHFDSFIQFYNTLLSLPIPMVLEHIHLFEVDNQLQIEMSILFVNTPDAQTPHDKTRPVISSDPFISSLTHSLIDIH